MTTQETIDLFNKYVIANYARLPRVIIRGRAATSLMRTATGYWTCFLAGP